MNNFSRSRSGVTTAAFGAVVAVLIITTVVGFGLYGTATGKTTTQVSTLTVTTTNEMMATTEMMVNHTTTEMMNGSTASNASIAEAFTAKSGAMITDAWIIAATIGMHECAVSIHAEGLEPNGTYIVEGSLATGSMQTVPISTEAMGMNTTSASEFQADKNGAGLFWIVLSNSISTTFEQVDLVYLPGMSMANATVVATVDTSGMMMSNPMTTATMNP